jgi:hypothetical protein
VLKRLQVAQKPGKADFFTPKPLTFREISLCRLGDFVMLFFRVFQFFAFFRTLPSRILETAKNFNY